jgi:hypothetical protein
MKKTNIAKAIALAITGTALSVGAISEASASATTMYNLTSAGGIDYSGIAACAPCNAGAGTDGWVWGFKGTPLGSTNSVAKWAGTVNANITPFDYNGGGALHWALHMTSNGVAEISSQDSVNRYGVGADIDTAKGAWSDIAVSGAQGWRHDLDFGLFKSDVGGTVTLNAQGINQSGTNFGFTIFKGMDTSNADYAHHGSWNLGNNTQIGAPTASSLPAGGTVFGATNAAAVANIVAYSIGGTTPSNLNTIRFTADAGQVYTIVLGGYRNGAWNLTSDGYKLNVSAVPVPGAVWLFGSAMAGLIGFGRRKNKSAV